MALRVIPVAEQARGQFNDGEILETKPIGFPQDGGDVQPYSSLFYWAHAWTPGAASLIGEHPHQGFEIMTFVLRGTIEHYDSAHDGWKRLEAGAAQVIRSGSGISHAERLLEDSAMFQIWIDPNLSETLRRPASYDDYARDAFPVTESDGVTTRTFHEGDAGPMRLDTAGITIKEVRFAGGAHDIVGDGERVLSAVLLDGNVAVAGHTLQPQDFVIADGGEGLQVEVDGAAGFFIIESPLEVPYSTYASRFGI